MSKSLLITAIVILALIISSSFALSCGGMGGMGGYDNSSSSGNYQGQCGSMQNMHAQMQGGNGMYGVTRINQWEAIIISRTN